MGLSITMIMWLGCSLSCVEQPCIKVMDLGLKWALNPEKFLTIPLKWSEMIVPLLVVAVVCSLLSSPFSILFCWVFFPPLPSMAATLGETGIATDLKYMISSPYNPKTDKRPFTSEEEESGRAQLIGRDGFVLGFKRKITSLLIPEECLCLQ